MAETNPRVLALLEKFYEVKCVAKLRDEMLNGIYSAEQNSVPDVHSLEMDCPIRIQDSFLETNSKQQVT